MIKFLVYLILLNFVIIINVKFLIYIFINLIFILIFIFMFSLNYNFYWINIYSWIGVDNYSLVLLILLFWIFGLIYISRIEFKNLKFYVFILLFMLIFLVLSFLRINYFIYYLFFEIRLIPTFLLILGWGYQPERVNAGMYILLYTLFASLPLLILLIYIYFSLGTLNYMILLNIDFKFDVNNLIIYIYIILAFLVKLPIFIFHLWLPKAHIEAPVTGSIILAAVILKLGGYGLVRRLIFILSLSVKYNYIFFIISLFGIIYLRILCLRCNDLKLIVAYSSVVHMGIILIGLISITIFGFIGGILIIIGHGLCSSALFLLINLIYLRTKSRNLLINKGIILFLPTLSMWWFIFCVINISAPISLNLLREIFILLVLLNWSFKILFLLIFSIYFSAIYRIYLFSYSQHGIFNKNLLKLSSNKVIEYILLLIHWVPLNFIILKIEIFF